MTVETAVKGYLPNKQVLGLSLFVTAAALTLARQKFLAYSQNVAVQYLAGSLLKNSPSLQKEGADLALKTVVPSSSLFSPLNILSRTASVALVIGALGALYLARRYWKRSEVYLENTHHNQVHINIHLNGVDSKKSPLVETKKEGSETTVCINVDKTKDTDTPS